MYCVCMSKLNLEKVVDLAGGQRALADKISERMQLEKPLKQGHVWGWLNRYSFGITAEYVIAACEVVNYQISPHQLRPDIYPHPHDGLPTHLREVA